MLVMVLVVVVVVLVVVVVCPGPHAREGMHPGISDPGFRLLADEVQQQAGG